MKYLVLVLLLVGGGLTASAQVKANLDVNIGTQPIWGPTGYDHAGYYYMPEYDVYYDVPNRRYTYMNSGHWKTSTNLPSRYHHVDLYHTYKVVLNEPKPYLHHDEHMRQYATDKTRHDQAVIRDSHEEKYWENKKHPEHNKWHGNDQNHH
jgi:hypothetical protein